MFSHVLDGRTYAVDEHRIIRDIGPFQNQPIFTPYFWHGYLDGTYDDEYWDERQHVIVFDVTEDDRHDYPELAAVTHVYIRLDVHDRIVTSVDSLSFQ